MFVGIDPGASGAIAAINTNGQIVSLLDWPGDPALAARVLWNLGPSSIKLAAIEKVASRPGQGVVSMFKFGQNYGMWLGILSSLEIKHQLVSPRQWQSGLVTPSDGGDPKARSLTVARRLYPEAGLHRARDHGRADALLLAHWAKSQS